MSDWRIDWWEVTEPGGRVLLWRKDGRVLAQSSGPPSFDAQAREDLVAGFTARRPHTEQSGPKEVSGGTPEEVIAAVTNAWGPRDALVAEPRPGMVVYHDHGVWAVTMAERSDHAVIPRYARQKIYRLALVPYGEQNGRRHLVPFATEIPVSLWPLQFLILVP